VGFLGCALERTEKGGAEADPFIDLLVELRTELRKQKLWALSDTVRDRLTSLGVIIEDSRDGSQWRWE
jgi:cysteinyl-tRNA synthetase